MLRTVVFQRFRAFSQCVRFDTCDAHMYAKLSVFLHAAFTLIRQLMTADHLSFDFKIKVFKSLAYNGVNAGKDLLNVAIFIHVYLDGQRLSPVIFEWSAWIKTVLVLT